MTLFRWSQTAANNATADSTCPFPENMAASAYNDGMRGAMAAVAKYRDDKAGIILTGGTSTSYTVSTYEGFDTLAHLHGQAIWFTPHTTNGNTVLLNADVLGAKPLRSALGIELLAGTLIQGTPYGAMYNNVDGAFYLQGLYGNPYSVPLLGALEFWDTTAPNSAFIFPAGQALSRTVYAYAFSKWGTTYGAGDGSTTFNVPDKTGRISAMKEAVASRLTSSYFGGNSANMGAVGGNESGTLIAANLPPYTPAGSLSASATINQDIYNGTSWGPGAGGFIILTGPNGTTNFGTHTATQAVTGTLVGTPTTGTSAPIRTVQPTIVCNYIIRVL